MTVTRDSTPGPEVAARADADADERPTADCDVVVPCYTLDRWAQLLDALESLRHQSLQPRRVVVVVDHNPELADRLRGHLSTPPQDPGSSGPEFVVTENVLARGVSGGRSTGADLCDTPLIAFLDDDATAHPRWLEELLSPFAQDPTVIGTGGWITPAFETHRPTWLPEEFDWVVGGSHKGLPTQRGRVRNVWGSSMAVRKQAFDAAGGFHAVFGKVGSRSRPEDTELCVRMAVANPGGWWCFVPEAVIDHHVPAQRTTFGYFLRRCLDEGRGKAELAALRTGAEGLTEERDYLRSALPKALLRNLSDAARERSTVPATRAGAIVAGLGTAGVGFGQTVLANLGERIRNR